MRNKRSVAGIGSLAECRPDLVAEWDWEKNQGYSPAELKSHSNRKVWWKCSKGHSWETGVNQRTTGRRGCPYCSGRLAIPGENDLETVNPELASQWDTQKNGELCPSKILPHSNRKVWWKCANGHEWITSVSERSNGKGCPYCSGHRSIPGEKDLPTLCPELATEWDEEKNMPIKAEDVLPNSFKVVWWKCRNGHSWKARIQARYLGEGCPYCSGRRAIPGKTDIGTLFPELLDEWDYARNAPLEAKELAPSSSRKIWWRCRNGHSWQTSLYCRSEKGLGCPFCSGQIPVRTRLTEL